MIGHTLLITGFIAALITVILSVYSSVRGSNWSLRVFAINIHSGAVIAASAYLLRALLTHQFQYHYVYANTDSTLAWPFLVSAFWAGQQGSFLFWALSGALVCSWLVWRYKDALDGIVVATVALAQAFLLYFVITDSPFRLMATVPLQGQGLNPLLRNPWMIIHPPIIFVAYALLVVPMAYAVSGLFTKKYADSMDQALPWTLLGWVLLGAGILIGGVWAYQVLGWGGYWAWDPVENSSLVPWLTCGALVHGLLLKRKRGGFVRANLFLAITTYLLVVLATFITRSGIMADFSVHAFAQTPLSSSIALFAVFFALLGYGLFGLRYSDMGQEEEQLLLLNRPLGISLTMIVLCTVAALVFLGTMAPIITGWFGLPASLDSSFFVRSNAPLAAVLLLLLGLLPVFGRSLTWGVIQQSLATSIVGLSACIVAAFAIGIRHPLHLLYLGVGAFSLFGTVGELGKAWKVQGFKFCGGHIAHLGIVFLLVGFMVSTSYTSTDTIYLPQGRAVHALSHQFTWQGAGSNEGALDIELRRSGRVGEASPKMYDVEGQQMREPGIWRSLIRDIYISPIEIIAEFSEQILAQPGRFFVYGEHSIQFSELRQNDSHSEGGTAEISAVLVVRYVGDVKMITPKLIVQNGIHEYIGAALPHSDEVVYLQAVDPVQGLAWFTIGKEPQPRLDVLVAEVKSKPLVSLLALGAIILTLGTAIACSRRFLA